MRRFSPPKSVALLRRPGTFLGMWVLLGLGFQAHASEDQTFREDIEVRWAEIKVVVTDSSGSPVPGLTVDRFRLRQGRDDIEIGHFIAIEDGHALQEASRLRNVHTANDRLVVVVYLDRSYAVPEELQLVNREVIRFLNDTLHPEDRTLLVEAAPELRILQPLSSLPEITADALFQLGPRLRGSRVMGEVDRLLADIRKTSARGQGITNLSREEIPMTLRAEIETVADQLRRELETSTHQLHRLLPALQGLPGRKILLYIGGPLPVEAIEVLQTAWNRTFGPGSAHQMRSENPIADVRFDQSWAPATMIRSGSQKLFAEVTRRANAAGVEVHFLDTGALRGSDFLAAHGARSRALGATRDGTQRIGSTDLLQTLAEQTGGRSVDGNRDYARALRELSSSLRNHYLLGFQARSDSLSDLEVEVTGPRGQKLKTSSRRSVHPRTGDLRMGDLAVSALIFGALDNPLEIDLELAPPLPSSVRPDLRVVPVRVTLPAKQLAWLEDQSSGQAQFSLFFTSGDLDMGASTAQRATVPLHSPPGKLDETLNRMIEYRIDLPIRVGSRRVAVAVRDDFNDLSAAAATDIPSTIDAPTQRSPAEGEVSGLPQSH